MQGRRTVQWVLLILLLLLSMARFGYEANKIREGGFVDFPIFWSQAREFVHTGQAYPSADNLASFEPVAPVYKFPPFYIALLVPLARTGIGDQVYLYHWIAQLLLYLGSGYLCLRAVRSARPVLCATLLAIMTLNFEPFFETLYGLQVETVLLALFAGCLFGVTRRKEALSGLMLSAAAMLKVYPAFLALYFVLRRRLNALLWVAIGGTLILLYSVAVVGAGEHTVYFGRILPFMLGENPDPIQTNMGIGRYLQLLGMSPANSKAWTRWIMLLPAALSCLLIYRSRDLSDRGLGRAAAFSLLLPLLLLTLPNSWSNYQMLLLPAFAVLLALVLEEHPDRRVLIALGAPAYVLGLFSENTPYLLSLIPIPEAVYEPILNMKFFTNALLWIAFVVVLRRNQESFGR